MGTTSTLKASEEAGVELIKRWFVAYNRIDVEGHLALVEYPLVAYGGGRIGRDNLQFTIREGPEGWGDDPGRGVAHRDEGWAFTTLDRAECVHSSDDKAHVIAAFTRYREDGTPYGTALTRLQIVMRGASGWRIRVLSSCGLRDPHDPAEPDDDRIVTEVQGVVERAVEALNRRDREALAQALHTPRLRLDGSDFTVVTDPDAPVPAWGDAGWSIEIERLDVLTPQAGDKAVVVADLVGHGGDGRRREDGAVLLVTKLEGRWGLHLASTRDGSVAFA